MTFVIGNGHDARVARVEIHESRVELWFEHLEVHVPEEAGLFGVWACKAHLLLEAPAAVSASWHQMNLWVLESELRVGGVLHGWEVLVQRQPDVTLGVTWTNGSTLSVTSAAFGLLHVQPGVRTAQRPG